VSGAAAAAAALAPQPSAAARRVGTARPVDDFRAVLARGGEHVTNAFRGLEAAVAELAGDALRADKAIEALRELRAEAARCVEEANFNGFVRRLRDNHGGGSASPSAFWLRLRAAAPELTLFHCDEAGGVDEVSPAEAAAFMRAAAAGAPPVAAPAPPPESLAKGGDEALDIE
jgi:hypothetical protein